MTSIRRIRRHLLRPFRENLKQMRYRWGLRIRYLFRRERPRLLLFVLAEPRTGSNLLIDYLTRVPGIIGLEEILNIRAEIGLRRWWISKKATLRHIDYSTNLEGEVVAVKLMLHHLRWHRLDVSDLGRRYPNGCYILLYRQDLAQQYVSAQMLMLTGMDRLRDRPRFTDTVRVDRDDFIRFCETQRKSFAELAMSAELRKRGIVCSYEELASEPQKLFDSRVFPLLDLDSVPVTTGMTKQNTRTLSQIVENYDEVADLLESDLARHSLGLGA